MIQYAPGTEYEVHQAIWLWYHQQLIQFTGKVTLTSQDEEYIYLESGSQKYIIEITQWTNALANKLVTEIPKPWPQRTITRVIYYIKRREGKKW